MPQTIVSTTSEYDVATDAEVAVLIEEFEAAKAAYDTAQAEAVAAYGEHPKFQSEDYLAKAEAMREPQARLSAANKALSASGNLPVGTAVSFVTSAGWGDNEHDSGVITQVTTTSYVVRKDLTGGTARLPREEAHEWKTSYGGGKGRSLGVVRTPRQQAAYATQQAEQRRLDALAREAKTARWEAESNLREALGKQAALGQIAKRRALDIILRRHAEEFAILEKDALDILVLDSEVPGREETAPLAPETA